MAKIFVIMAKIFANFAIIFRHLAIFVILAINFLDIFAIMAKMARMAKKFIAIFRHSYYCFPKNRWQN